MRRQKKSVLVVDDTPEMRRAIARAMRRAGFETIEAESACQALEMLSSLAAVDLVITDRSMPRINGDQFAVRLRGRGERVPILMVSGDPGLPQRIDCIDAIIRKPFSDGDLQTAVARVLRADAESA